MTTDAKMSPEAPDEGPLTSFQRAARLADADELTETRVADAIQDAEFDCLNFPTVIAARHGGQTGCTVMQMRKLLVLLSGALAESVAHDMDHKCKDHSKWYRHVEAARKLLETIPFIAPEP